MSSPEDPPPRWRRTSVLALALCWPPGSMVQSWMERQWQRSVLEASGAGALQEWAVGLCLLDVPTAGRWVRLIALPGAGLLKTPTPPPGDRLGLLGEARRFWWPLCR